MNLDLSDEEAKLLKSILGQHHKDKKISDQESNDTYVLYKKISNLIRAAGKNTTKKVKDAKPADSDQN